MLGNISTFSRSNLNGNVCEMCCVVYVRALLRRLRLMIFCTLGDSLGLFVQHGRKQMRLIFFQFVLDFDDDERENEITMRLRGSDRESEMRLFYFELLFFVFGFLWAM